ncbi:unnamed protein product [Cylindrotheca closterium]|uniref:DUF676 domain-containing protein n=1 Tax=Cylindrotheca closterium TaxID=2856 RepID=A0AAD2CSW0_9STRA|nr:unnamed protein product [Cylindrotheca closterium]
MVLALLLPNSSSILPWMMSTNPAATTIKASALAQRAGLHMKRCASNGRLLSQSLCVNPFDDTDNNTTTNNDNSETNHNNNKQQQEQGATTTLQNAPSDVHLIVLIHGWLGNPKEMDGLKESLMEQSQIQLDKEKENADNKKKSSSSSSSSSRVVVHSVRCNDGKTSDGIVAGGKRVAAEINEMIQEIRDRSTSTTNVNDDNNNNNNNGGNIRLSIAGNSLGGLYGRYALSEIDWTTKDTNNNDGDDDDPQQQQQEQAPAQSQLIPHYFVTTATPHLGCGFQQTYLPLPRFIEHPLGNIMLRTGQDLFRLFSGKDDIIQEMAFSPTFLNPLRKFHKRMAYANAHGTDLQVPLPSAAFWAPTDSVHTVVEHDAEHAFIVPRGVALTLTTPKQEEEESNSIITEPKQVVATSEEISKRLDQLGWTKVLIDVRHEMPINLNTAVDNESASTSSTSSTSSTEDANEQKQQKQQWTAKELLEQFDTGRLKSLPIGHMVMVANSKNEFYRNMCKPGIPIMDYLAREIINSI